MLTWNLANHVFNSLPQLINLLRRRARLELE